MTAKDFITGLPDKVSPDAIDGHNTLFHFDIPGDGGGAYTLSIADGKATVTEGHEGEAKCVVTANDTDFVDIVSGKTNPMMAFMMGKIKVSNQGEMLKYAKILGLM